MTAIAAGPSQPDAFTGATEAFTPHSDGVPPAIVAGGLGIVVGGTAMVLGAGIPFLPMIGAALAIGSLLFCIDWAADTFFNKSITRYLTGKSPDDLVHQGWEGLKRVSSGVSLRPQTT